MVSAGNSFDFIVIGTGSMGSAACFNLARRGFKVLGLDRFPVPHSHGAHSGHTRLIRKAYFEHEDYVPLLDRAYALWDEIQEISGRRVFERTGLLYAGPQGDELLAGVRFAADRYGIELEREVDPTRLPQFTIPDGFEMLFEPDAGYLITDSAIEAFASEARRLGAVMREGERVIRWEPVGDGVRVDTEKESFHGGKVVITAGPWAAQVIPGIAGRLSVTRQVLAWFDVGEAADFAVGRFPCWAIVDPGAPGLYYGFPFAASGSPDEPRGLKLAHHHPGGVTRPDDVSREVTESDTLPLADFLSRRIPGVSGPLTGSSTCLYSNTPDGHFVIDNLPGLEKHSCVAWGFSGHGFKFASVVGEILADLAVSGRTDHPISFLSASRFS